MKKLNLLLLAATTLVGTAGLSSCGTNLTKIGILQVATFDALDHCREGFISGLAAEGFIEGENVEFTIQNPEGDSPTQDSMAINLATNCDMVFGISTGSSLALKNAVADQGKDTPVLFSAVTDPVDAGLVTSFIEHDNIVGTSDGGPTAQNIELFTEFDNIKKIGIIYNSAEPNSVVQKNETAEACDRFGLTLVDGGITSQTEIDSTLQNFVAQGVQGVFIPTDNTLAAAIEGMKDVFETNKLVAVCADSLVTQSGGSLGFSVDYTNLGETTGKMAAKILQGTDITTIPCSKSETFPLSVRPDFFTATGIAIPSAIQSILDSQEA